MRLLSIKNIGFVGKIILKTKIVKEDIYFIDSLCPIKQDLLVCIDTKWEIVKQVHCGKGTFTTFIRRKWINYTQI